MVKALKTPLFVSRDGCWEIRRQRKVYFLKKRWFYVGGEVKQKNLDIKPVEKSQISTVK